MKLYFLCPDKNQGFWSASWSVPEAFTEVEVSEGKTLRGSVQVLCPCCGGVHTYQPEEISCPLESPPSGTNDG